MSEYALKRHGGNSLEVKLFLPMPLYSAPQKLLHSLPVFFVVLASSTALAFVRAMLVLPMRCPSQFLSICLNRTNPRGSKWVWESAKKSKKNNHAESRWITRVFFPQAVSYGLITRNHAGYFFKKMRRQTYSRSCMSFYIIVRQTVLISWMDVVQVILCVA